MFQEALTNVVRHAQASAVRVRLTNKEGRFELRVSDNGCGITLAQIHDAGAVGLLGMRERASQAGGTLEIAGIPGKGTMITVRVPIPRMLPPRPRAPVRARRATARVRRRR
jgi:signal transduction histidine kinase